MNKFRFFTLCLLSMFAFAACNSAVEDGGMEEYEGKVNIVATVGMAADLAANVGGDNVVVESIMGPGVDPHLYQPSAGDIRLMEDADIVVYVGLHLEGKMTELLEEMGKEKKVVALTESIDEERLVAAADSYEFDPHIWFDVDLWRGTVSSLEAALVNFDPDNAEAYSASASRYSRELEELDKWVNERVKELPEEQRVLITAHDAFEYFGKAYGFEVRGIQGISTASDYGLKDLEELIDFVVERKVKAIFVETSVSDKSIRSLKEGVSAEGHEVVIGGELFSDAMGDSGSEEGTYVGMVKYNVNTIIDALK